MSPTPAALALLCAIGSSPCLAGQGAAADCVSAAAEVERDWALPDNLLLAIGLAESGQREAATGRLRPSPYSVNVAGTDVAFVSADYAIAAVAALRGRGVRSIDVGCFQINLLHHPDAFPNLSDAFDAHANARYAGAFLRRLFARSGDWGSAVAAYHSADAVRGGAYRDRVLRFWRDLEGATRAVAAPSVIPVYGPATLPAWLRRRLPFLIQP